MVRAASPRSADMRHVFTGDVIRSFTFMTHLRYRGPAEFRHDAEPLTAVRRSSPPAALERRIAEQTCKLAAAAMAEALPFDRARGSYATSSGSRASFCVAVTRAGRRCGLWRLAHDADAHAEHLQLRRHAVGPRPRKQRPDRDRPRRDRRRPRVDRATRRTA